LLFSDQGSWPTIPPSTFVGSLSHIFYRPCILRTKCELSRAGSSGPSVPVPKVYFLAVPTLAYQPFCVIRPLATCVSASGISHLRVIARSARWNSPHAMLLSVGCVPTTVIVDTIHSLSLRLGSKQNRIGRVRETIVPYATFGGAHIASGRPRIR
jgi:hypothetical protein